MSSASASQVQVQKKYQCQVQVPALYIPKLYITYIQLYSYIPESILKIQNKGASTKKYQCQVQVLVLCTSAKQIYSKCDEHRQKMFKIGICLQ